MLLFMSQFQKQTVARIHPVLATLLVMKRRQP